MPRAIEMPCPWVGSLRGYVGELDTVMSHDQETCPVCSVYGLPIAIDTLIEGDQFYLTTDDTNMDLDTVVARLRAGLPVVCGHDVYEVATRHVSATAFAAAHAARTATPEAPADLCDDPA